MESLIIVTPVKNSVETAVQAIRRIHSAKGNFTHYVYNDFSTEESKTKLNEAQAELGFELIHLEDVVDTPSPNYRYVLQDIQRKAIAQNAGVLLIESDVYVQDDTISQLYDYACKLDNCGMLASVTVDGEGTINFPYLHIKKEYGDIQHTKKRLSFCCTVLTLDYLKKYDLMTLPTNKDWFDVPISKKSRTLGFKNYVLTNVPVEHLPHSSRPWKQLKYSNPLKYYFNKFIHRRDKI